MLWMKRSLTLVVIALALCSDRSAPGAETRAPVYVIAQVGIENAKEFGRYQQAALAAIMENKGKTLVATNTADVLEGGWPGNWTVVIEFPSMDDAQRWYASPAYQKAIPIRKGSTSLTNMAIVKSFQGD